MKTKKVVQGSYISIEAKRLLFQEALRQDKKIATLTSEILEKEAKKIQRKEFYKGETIDESKQI
jgi:hypothetical protein